MMDIIKYLDKSDWTSIVNRPTLNTEDLDDKVISILKEVKKSGDKALYKYAKKFEKVDLDSLLVTEEEIIKAKNLVTTELKEAISVAKNNIQKFHSSQLAVEPKVETMKGVNCWRKSVAISKVGLYIPGGSAPLFSTILMLAIPALIAGCEDIVVCTPCDSDGEIHPAILYTCDQLGLRDVFKVGGAQAIGAMAYGTESIPQVYKIFGPGNQYVTKAKELVTLSGVAIDMPAGPSELLIIADETAIPEFVAADLLSQAEHGEDSQVVLVSTSIDIMNRTIECIKSQVKELPRKSIALKALKFSRALLFEDMKSCFEFSNTYAPEHLIVASDYTKAWVDEIQNAGSVFLGNYTCESAGDYASGTNHTLPTSGFARNYSGVSVDSFLKKITFQEITKSGLSLIGSTIETMATAEGLLAHKNAVSIRLKTIEDV